nr:T9SS type A sorting domain-containing protein [Saprospiraceae bacterium]
MLKTPYLIHCLKMVVVLFLFIQDSGQLLNSQPIDAPYGCHHIHNNFQSYGVFTHRSDAAQKVIRRSDTLNLYHYEIHLDVTRFISGEIYGRTIVHLESLMDSIHVITLDLEGLTVDSVNIEQSAMPFSHDGRFLRIFSDEPLSANDSIEAEVFYHGSPITCPSGFGGFYFENGYAYNLGIGLAADPHNFGRSWFPCFDNFVQRSTFEYHVKSEGGRKAHAVGRFIEEQALAGDTLVRVYRMEQPIPTYLSSVAVSNYRTMDWTHQGAYGPVDIQLIARSGDLDNFRASLEDLEYAIDALEYWYGPYPFERIGYVITTRGAMEHPTNTAYPSHSIAGGQKSTRLMAHELCHHWWGNLTTLTTAKDMWIKEGPAEYGAHLTQEFINGPEGLKTAVRNNHQTTIETAHTVDDGYFALSPMPAYNTYGRHTYIRGASVIHNLRGYLGDSLFRHGMQGVLMDNSFSAIDAYEFRDQLTDLTGCDLTHFFNDWIFAPGYADFSIDSFRVIGQSGNKHLVETFFKQRKYQSPHYHLEVPLQITFGNAGQKTSVRMIASDSLSSDTIALEFIPEWAVLNDEHSLNLASFTSVLKIDQPGTIQDPYTRTRWVTDQVEDSVLLYIEHHYSGPDKPEAMDPDFRISANHYFAVKGNFDESWKATLTLRIEGKGNLALDSDLVSITEDSLILVYRPDRATEWVEYPHYTKHILIPGSGSGFINIQKIQSGEYAFANSFFKGGTPTVDRNQPDIEFSLYPNPLTTNTLHIASGQQEGNYRATIYDLRGTEVMTIPVLHISPEAEQSIDLKNLLPGTYFLNLSKTGDQSQYMNSNLNVLPFIKQ